MVTCWDIITTVIVDLIERRALFTKDDHTFALCAYGESPYLEECIRSLVAQTVKTNIIIATSTPNTLISSLAERYGIPLFVNEGKPGIAHDWNCAIAHCDTPLVTISHQDDVYEPVYAESMLDNVNSVSDSLLFFTNYGELRNGKRVDDNRLLTVKRALLKPLECRLFRKSVFVRRRCLSLGSSICCPSVTLVLPAIGTPVFQVGFKSDLDWQAWERISRLSGSFLYDSDIRMYHRIHEGSETSALIHDNTRTKEDLEMLSRFWPRPIAAFINRFYSSSQSSNDSQ